MPYANNKGADQPAHARSLINAFVVRCLDSIISSFYIRNLKSLASFCGCAGWFESLTYANNKGTDQPAHARSLISAFIVCCLDSIISSFYIRNFKSLASFCDCAGWFESYLVENLKTGFLMTWLILLQLL